MGGSIGVAVVSTVADSGIQSQSADGFTDAFAVCTLAAAASAAVARIHDKWMVRQAEEGLARIADPTDWHQLS